MTLALVTLFLIALALCALLNLASLPGNWLLAGLTLLWAFFGPESHAGGMTLLFFVWLVGLAALGEAAEFLIQIWGGKKYGASNKATVFGIIGAIAGAILLAPLLFGLGALLGALGGAWCGSFVAERVLANKAMPEAVRAANGALLGRFLGMVVKFGLGVSMVALTAAAVW